MKRKQLLRASDIAAELGVTTGRIYQLIADKHIPAVRINRSVFIPRKAWETWLRQCNEQAVAEGTVRQQVQVDDGHAA